ncbi:FAD-binding oxidoreductase [Agriterribacter sp.]|uniref:NAD(P)/FAD-dependent oxidoreductase n=1 Tax=Agriterribacter sp. TaxID=2821509 RepID=UPI002BD23785|nr:FAD-binding oxidoreductase [Agriterribacter sp.]HRO45147.1 FAD-binding oxidoreductase [Agriterribacter sp.]HRQ17752.1 FAD-binding oxidoreductase [Agriterribacter sp.]
MDLKSNEPFWLVKNGILNSYPSLREDAACDVLIVGGGITGGLIAHQCIADGFDTILIDKREIANGSSSATTSMLQYEIDTPLYELTEMIGEKGAVASYKACAEAIGQLGGIAKKIRSKAGFKQKDSLYFAALKKDKEWLRKEFEARKNAGFEVKWMEAEAIQKKYKLDKAFGGILSKQGASVDAFMLVHEILEYNCKRGLQVYDKTGLADVRYGTRLNEVNVSTGATIKAKKIVYCIGYESTTMIREKFVDLISTFAIVSEVEPGLSRQYKDVLIWNTSDPYVYLRTTDDGRMLIGGEDEEFRNPQKRDALIAKKEQKLVRSFEKYLPQATFHTDFAWAGTFGETKDGLPYISEHKDFKNSYFVLGFGGNGITFSVTGMEMVSYWLKGRKHLLSEWFQFGR